MRLYSVLAVVAALTASISASDATSDVANEYCPLFCVRDSTCSPCEGGFCVSISSLCPGIDYMTHRHDRASLYASSMAVSRVFAFAMAQYGSWHDMWSLNQTLGYWGGIRTLVVAEARFGVIRRWGIGMTSISEVGDWGVLWCQSPCKLGDCTKPVFCELA